MNVGTCFPLQGKIETEALSVVLLQMSPAKGALTLEDVDKNIDKVIEMIKRSATAMPGFDLILTPEIILDGSSPDHTKSLVTLDGPQVQRLKDICKELKIWGVFGAFADLKDGAYLRNVAITINDKGEIVNVYSKTNPWIPRENSTAGDEIQVFEGPKGSRIATIICSDGDYIDTWREAAAKGANVIVRISDYMTPYQEAYELTNRAGAYFTRTYVLATNTCEMDPGFCLFGNSMVVSPEGTVITKAPEGIPYILKADIYPGLCDHIKTQSLMGNLEWQGNHRGAASPDTPGTGKDKSSLYTYLKGGQS